MIRATALGVLISGSGWLALGVGFAMASIPAAAFGLAVIGVSLAARGQVRAQWPEISFTSGEGTEGEELVLTTTIAGAGAGLDAIPGVPAGTLLLDEERHHQLGVIRIIQRLQPERSGLLSVPGPKVFITDPWGLYAREFQSRTPHRIVVRPATTWLGSGQRAGRRHTVQELVEGPRKLEIQPEVESIRPWRAGDKLRDIDWPRSTRGEIVSRERVRVDPRPVTVILDATSSMRWHRKTAKLTTASRIAFGVLAAAMAAGVEARLITVRDTGISTGKGTRGLTKAFDELRKSDPPIAVDEVPRRVQSTGGGVAFLRAAGRLRPIGATSQPPLQEALVQALRKPGFVVFIVDGEDAPKETCAAIKKIRRDASGAVIVPASGAHHYSRPDGSQNIGRLETWHANRLQVMETARRLRVPAAVAFPGDEEKIIAEVAAWLA